MQMNLFTRRFAAWTACLAILLSALAPAVSHALALARGGDIAWMEVCSVAGIKLVKADAGADARKPGAPTSHETLAQAGHCPFCSTHDASFGLPPAAPIVFQPAAAQRVRPLLFYRSPKPLPIWTDAQSRAPPRVS